MSFGLAVLVGAIAGFMGHVLTKGEDGVSLLALVYVALGVFVGWTVAQFIG